jgi:hypothetical protein
MKPVAKRKVTISLTEDEWKFFYAYAHVKGHGTAHAIANLARTAIIATIARNAPTEAQARRIDEIVGELK